MKLTRNFSLTELCRSQVAARHSIDNTPNSNQMAALKALTQNILEPIRGSFGLPFTPSSGFRCEALNSKIGGSKNSQHSKGEAVDLELPGVDNWELAEWVSKNLTFDQLILEYYEHRKPGSGWVHVSYCEGRNRGEILSKDKLGYRAGLHPVRE